MEAFAGALATVFFALFDAGVAGEQVLCAEQRAILRCCFGECTGDAVTNGADLTGDTTAADIDENVEASLCISCFEWESDFASQTWTVAYVIFDGAVVDGDLAGTRYEANACGRCFSSACSVILNYASHRNLFPLLALAGSCHRR